MKTTFIVIIEICLLVLGFAGLPQDLFLTLFVVSQAISFCLFGYFNKASCKIALAAFVSSGVMPLVVFILVVFMNGRVNLPKLNLNETLVLIAGGMNVVGYLSGIALRAGKAPG